MWEFADIAKWLMRRTCNAKVPSSSLGIGLLNIAQLAEHRTVNPCVAGSSPAVEIIVS